MASSAARIEANRRNAQKSTGPKSPEGKARSRANALKHGLAGSGVVIPADDLAKVAEIEAKLVADTPPASEVVASLLHRYAVLSVRLDRCADHDAAMTARRVRNAVRDRDNERWDEVAAQGRRLAEEPSDAVRRLKQTPEGIDWLVGRWEDIRAELTDPDSDPADLASRAGGLLGLSPARVRVSAWGTWARTAEGDPAAWVEAEVARLEALRAGIDWEAEEADRAEAGARALLDFSPEGERMRRYEAAAERHLYRTLHELRRAEEEARNEAKPESEPAPEPAPAREPAAAPLPPPASRSILDGLPAVSREVDRRVDGFLDLFAAAPATMASGNGTKPRAARPRLR